MTEKSYGEIAYQTWTDRVQDDEDDTTTWDAIAQAVIAAYEERRRCDNCKNEVYHNGGCTLHPESFDCQGGHNCKAWEPRQ
jgi:hypothetical protein